MPQPNLLVIAVDGLRASALGCYGNTWYRTPTLDRLAAESLLCDFAFADATDLDRIYRGLWQSLSALRSAAFADGSWSLPAHLTDSGYYTRLVTNVEELTELVAAQHFAEAVVVPCEALSDVREVEQTCTASIVAEVLDFLETPRAANSPWFLWTHLSGLYGEWDAPHDLALSLVEEDDTPPEPTPIAPELQVKRLADAERIFAESCRYAAQVMSLDLLLEPLMHFIESGAVGKCVLVLLGTRGFPLGEHGRLGGVDDRLYSEQLHVPFLVRLPSGVGALERMSRLLLPCDLPATLLSLLGVQEVPTRDGLSFVELVRDPHARWRGFSLAIGADHTVSIRTPAWYLRGVNGNATPELFVKPDDRWEANDVTSRCAEIVEELAALARTERDRTADGEPLSMAALPPSLSEPIR
jgi:arylsulfatase A-like enzyme